VLTRECQPWTEEGTALLEKAAGQGHVYAMYALRGIHGSRKHYDEAVKWNRKAADAGLPIAMFNLGAGAYTPSHFRST
jgi:TPR repeat protein